MKTVFIFSIFVTCFYSCTSQTEETMYAYVSGEACFNFSLGYNLSTDPIHISHNESFFDVIFYHNDTDEIYAGGERISSWEIRRSVGYILVCISNITVNDGGKYAVSYYNGSATIELVIAYPPNANPVIQQIPNGAINASNTVRLICTVSGGNPLPTLSWNCTGTYTNNTSGNTASYSVEFNVDKTYNNRICTCSASHPDTSYRPSIQHKLEVYYSPDDHPSIQQYPPGPIISGDIVTLNCTLEGGNPLAILSWNCTGLYTNNTSENTASFSVEITVKKADNNRICSCLATHPVTVYSRSVQHKLVVYYSPDLLPSIQQLPSGPVISGNKLKLNCTVSGGNPLAILSWNCTGLYTNNTSENTASYSVEIIVTKADNNRICTCSATHPVGVYRPSLHHTLVVYFSPDILPTIQQYPPGPVISGDEVILNCTLEGGNPLATLSWDCSGSYTQNNVRNLASYSVEITVNKLDNNRICTCSATHPVSAYRPSVKHGLVVYYAPDNQPTIQQTPEGPIITGHEVILRCMVLGGHPLAILAWNCSGLYTDNTSGNMSSYSVKITVTKADNNKICVCSATHPDSAYRPIVKQELNVYYGPGNPTFKPVPAMPWFESNSSRLNCVFENGNPAATILWKRDGEIMQSSTNASGLQFWHLSHEDNGAAITCIVYNNYSYMTQEIILDVQYYPRFTVHEQTIVAHSGQDISLNCSTFGNPAPTVQWFRKENPLTVETKSQAVLMLHSISRIDSGNYTCFSKENSNYGILKESLVFYVDVKVKPETPVIVFAVCKATSADILWKSEFNGGLKQEFFIQYWTSGQSTRTLSSKIEDLGMNTNMIFTIQNLSPNTKYHFLIISRNLIGDSLSAQLNCTTEEKQENSKLFEVGVSFLTISVLILISMVTFVVIRRFRNKKRKQIARSEKYMDYTTCNPSFTDDTYEPIANTCHSGVTDKSKINKRSNITKDVKPPSPRKNNVYQNLRPPVKGITDKSERYNATENVQPPLAKKKKVYDNVKGKSKIDSGIYENVRV